MSYGHAHHLNAMSDQAKPGASPADDLAPPVDPALYRRDGVRPVLAERDIAALYLLLKGEGVTQRQIAELTGQSQSEVSEILAGRKVQSYDLLVRIAEGFHVPRELMGLSYGDSTAYCGQGTLADPPQGVDTEMLRRRLIELGAGLAVCAPAAKLAPLLERLELPDPSPVVLPSQLGAVHVAKVRDLTRRLGDARRVYGPDPEVSGAAAAWGRRLLDVPSTDGSGTGAGSPTSARWPSSSPSLASGAPSARPAPSSIRRRRNISVSTPWGGSAIVPCPP